MRTMSVVVEVRELVAPLRYYAQRVFKESNNDQEASDCWEVAV